MKLFNASDPLIFVLAIGIAFLVTIIICSVFFPIKIESNPPISVCIEEYKFISTPRHLIQLMDEHGHGISCK